MWVTSLKMNEIFFDRFSGIQEVKLPKAKPAERVVKTDIKTQASLK